MYELYIANKNYSSWSLRPWLLMRERGIPFTERLMLFGDAAKWDAYRKISPAGLVPCLVDGGTAVWETLAIVEYLAERHDGVWPAEPVARAWARSAAAEMHAGFGALRNTCSMSVGIRVRLRETPPALRRDVDRLDALWRQGLERFGGPYLAGPALTAVDAFFAPVAFRIRSYDLKLGDAAMDYAARLLALPAMRDWEKAALAETAREAGHEAESAAAGTIVEDRRAKPG